MTGTSVPADRLLAMTVAAVFLTSAAACPAVAQPPLAALPAGDASPDPRVAPAAALSHDGRFVAFESMLPLLEADANGVRDVYLFDRQTRTLTLVSRGRDGLAGDGPSRHPTISADGRRVAFESLARTLGSGPPPVDQHVYVSDRQTGEVRLVTADADGAPITGNHGGARMSADGRFVVFHSDAGVERWGACGRTVGFQIYRHDVDDGVTRAVTVACDGSAGTASFPAISGDGSRVAYVRRASSATVSEVWVYDVSRDVHHRAIEAVDQAPPDGPTYAPALSADGRWLAVISRATNLTRVPLQRPEPQVYVRRLDDGPVQLISAASDGREGNGASALPALDADGRHLVFHSTASNLDHRVGHGDVNLVSDVFVWSQEKVTRVSHDPHEPWLDVSEAPTISGDGRLVAFSSRQPVSAEDDRGTFDLFLRVAAR